MGMGTTLTTREFFRSPRKVAELLKRGAKITVTRAREPFFEVVPAQKKRGATLADFKHLIFSDKKMDRNASKKIDVILYGGR